MAGDEGVAKTSKADEHPSGASAPVFISYASQDGAVAKSIIENLEQHGLKCWIAPRDVKPGAQYADAIVRAITDAKALVLVMSASAVTSAHVGREVERAASKHKQIIAFRIDAAPLNAALEYFLSQSQWIDVPALGLKVALANVAEAVGNVSGSSAIPSSDHPAAHPRTAKRVVIAAATMIALGAAVAVGIRFWHRNGVGVQKPVAALVSEKSIAVLPFADMSEKKDQEYFADGMAEEILDLLGQIPSLRVIGRTSSFQFKGKHEDLRSIGTTLHATYLLDGSVRKAADRVRVTAQLIDTRDGTHVWSGTFDREFGEILKLQHEIAMQIARALQVTVGKEGLQAQSKLSSAESYTLYLRGRLAMDRDDEAAIQEAQTDFERALQLDPSFTSAADELAIAFVGQVAEQYVPSEIGWQRVKEAADRALILDAHSASAHVALALRHALYEFDFKAADAELAEAQKYHPQDARTLGALARMAFVHGRYDDALRLVNTSLAVDPLSPLMLQLQGFIHYYAGRFSAAEASIRRGIEISPTFDGNHYLLGQILLDQGHPDSALKETQLELDVGGRDAGSAMVYHAMGRRMESDRALAELMQRAAAIWPTGIADVYAFRGQIDESFQWLDKAYAQRNISLQFVYGSPLLRNLRGDPRYKAFLKKMNLVE